MRSEVKNQTEACEGPQEVNIEKGKSFMISLVGHDDMFTVFGREDFYVLVTLKG